MNSIDSIYYQAIESANRGRLDQTAVRKIYEQAAKFNVLQMPEDSARYYERLFQICLTTEKNGRDITDGDMSRYCMAALNEYVKLLEGMQRTERAESVREFISRVWT